MPQPSVPYPKCDGSSAPLADDEIDQKKLIFLKAFADLNAAYQALLDVRANTSVADFKGLERAALQRIESAILAKEKLDRAHASQGFFATPEFKEGFVVNVTFGHHASARSPQPEARRASAFVTLMEGPFGAPPGFDPFKV